MSLALFYLTRHLSAGPNQPTPRVSTLLVVYTAVVTVFKVSTILMHSAHVKERQALMVVPLQAWTQKN